MSFIIGAIIFTGGFKISKEAFFILMEGVPGEINLKKLKEHSTMGFKGDGV